MVEASWGVRFPRLLEHMSDESWEDGSARETSTLTLKVEAGRWNVALNDRCAKASGYVTADTMEGALEALETALEECRVDWRPWGGRKRK